jgi:predicted dehydrogenase
MNPRHMLNRRTLLSASAASLAAVPLLAQESSRKPPKIKIGQIGVGHPHASKLSVYRASPDYEVLGIVEPNKTLREQAQSQPAFRDLPWMTQEQLVSAPGLQAILVETEVRDLLSTAEACIAAGKHIHLDKPAGESLPQFERILATAKKQSLLVQMGYMYRYNPAILLLRKFLREGWLGDIFEIHTVMSKTLDAEDRKAQAQYRGGMMFELGCHILDLVIGVLGEPTEVAAFSQHASAQDDNLLDNMLAVLKYPKAIASVKSSAQEVDGGARRHFVVCGSGGTFHIQPLDDPSAHVTLKEKHADYPAGAQDIKFPKFTRYIADAADMAKIIRGEKPSDFSYDHDLSVQRTLLKACTLS